MAEILQIGNGIVAPLTYETIEEVEAGTGRMREAMEQEGWNPAEMDPVELMRKTNQYYQ